jgi:hypothetical protein
MMKKRSFIIWYLLLLIGSFYLIDRTLGFVAEKIFFNQKTGKYSRLTYALYKSKADIIILGNSHANRHYVPSILRNKLGMSAYNAGVQGQNLIFHETVLKIILKRYSPKIILFDIDPDCLEKRQGTYDRLADLYPYFGDFHEILKPLIRLKSPADYWFLHLKSYRFNSTIVHALIYLVSPQHDENGYIPLYGEIKSATVSRADLDISNSSKSPEIDFQLLKSFKNITQIATCKDYKFIMSTSPHFDSNDISKNCSYKMISSLLNYKNVYWLNCIKDREFVGQKILFHDASHLNTEGAHLFSLRLCSKMSKLIHNDR